MNDWMANTTYTPASGLGSAFKWGLNSSMPQGLSQKGWEGLGGAMSGMGKGMLMQGQGAFQNPAAGLAQGLGDGAARMRQFSPPQGAFGDSGAQQQPLLDIRKLFGG